MKSIGARVAVWYASAATVTLACLFVAGYVLLQNQLVDGLDLLNEAGFKEIEAYLGPDYRTLSAPSIESRIREVTDHASTLFYIDVHVPGKGTIFRSTNLSSQDLPDVPGERHFTVQVAGIGELRVAEYHKMPFEVSIATPLRPVRDVMASYVRVCLSLLAAMLIASIAIGLGLTRLVLWPVRLMRDTANRIGSDNLSERVPVPDARDEISDLARLLNQMFDRLESSFVQIRRFTADASHELKMPLSLIRLHAEKMLVDSSLSPAHKEAVQVQLEEIARLNRIIDELLFLSRADAKALKLDLKAQNPKALVQAFAQDASVLAEHHGRRFTCEHQGEGSVELEPKWMRQVLLNLLTNAIHVSPAGGVISLQSVVSDSLWRVSVEDEGPGLTAEQRERMFERFVRLVTPDTEYQGSGLGLAICRSIVDLHGGKISAAPRPAGRGLRVLLEIPAVKRLGCLALALLLGIPCAHAEDKEKTEIDLARDRMIEAKRYKVYYTNKFDLSGIFVHKDNPISKLTLKQLDGIFGSERSGGWTALEWDESVARGPEGNIRTWGELGLAGEWKDNRAGAEQVGRMQIMINTLLAFLIAVGLVRSVAARAGNSTTISSAARRRSVRSTQAQPTLVSLAAR